MLRALAVVALLSSAAPADPCSDLVACCTAAAPALGADPNQCKGMAAAKSSCDQIKNALVQALTAQGKTVPTACVSQAGGGGGEGSAKAPPKPAEPEPKDQPMRPLPAENDKPVADAGVACLIERVDGKRTILTGDDEQLQVKCTGATITPATAKITWTASTTVGEIHAQLFDHAAYRAPMKVTGSANENIIHAKVKVDGHTVDAVRTMHVINKHLRLTVTGHIAGHCSEGKGGSIIVGFEVLCKQSVDLEVGKDWTVSSSNPQSCAPNWTNLRGCGPGVSALPPQAKWAIRGAVGKIDPDSATMELQIDGDRVGMPTISPGEAAHTNSLFPRALPINPDDNTMRVFGSMTTNAIMGNQTIFELDAR